MSSRSSAAILRPTALLLVAVLLATCSGGPRSQATTSEGPSTALESAAPSQAPASAEPVSEEPASEAPSQPAATEAPSAEPTPAVEPTRPAKVTFKHLGTKTVSGKIKETYRVSWTAPRGVATSFVVYGVRDCLRASRQNHRKPCVGKGMRIPRDTLQVLATVAGGVRTVDVTWTAPEIGPGPYYAVLVRATNDAGDSIFAIAWSDKVCWQCTY